LQPFSLDAGNDKQLNLLPLAQGTTAIIPLKLTTWGLDDGGTITQLQDC